MLWISILLGLAIVIGPALYLLPTRRDKAQAALRTAARQTGLVVELASIYKADSAPHERVSAGAQALSPKVQCARYGLPMGAPLAGLPEVHLVNGPRTGWQPDPEYPAVANADLVAELQPLLAGLPEQALGLAVTASLVWVYWLETLDGAASGPDRVEEIKRTLSLIRERAAKWHARWIS